MNNNKYNCYIGVDVSKKILDVALGSSFFQVENSISGYKDLFKHIPKKESVLVVMEASGGYEKNVVGWLTKKGISVSVVYAFTHLPSCRKK